MVLVIGEDVEADSEVSMSRPRRMKGLLLQSITVQNHRNGIIEMAKIALPEDVD